MRVGLRPSLVARWWFARLPSHPWPGENVLHNRGDLDHRARRERSSPGHQRRSEAPRGILGLRARVLTQRQDAGLRPAAQKEGTQVSPVRGRRALLSCCVRPEPRLLWLPRRCSSDHTMEAELPGSPRVLPRRQAGALPLSARGRAGPLEPLLGPPRWHRPPPTHPGGCAKADLLVRWLKLLSELLR